MTHQAPTPEKFCAQCGRKVERNRLKNGQIESLYAFARRKYCGPDCRPWQRVDLTKVLVMPGWPSGFCPTHYGERPRYCGAACQPARIALADLNTEYQQLWWSIYGRDAA